MLELKLEQNQQSLDASHKLFHMNKAGDGDDFTSIKFSFASSYIAKECTARLCALHEGEVKRFLSIRDSRLGNLQGAVFEELAHEKLQKGGRFIIRELVNPQSRTAADSTVSIPPLGLVEFLGGLGSLETMDLSGRRYFKPKNGNLPALDSVAMLNNVPGHPGKCLVGF